MRFRSHKKTPLTMDVTPLVDVVFLLLIFFMVTTTFSLDQGIKLDLPKAETSENNQSEKKESNIRVIVDSEDRYFIQGSQVAREQLTESLLRLSQNRKDSIIHVQADKNSSHGSIVYLMDRARGLNLVHISLITLDKGEEIQ
jgi:biopolymer transport protein ExbD